MTKRLSPEEKAGRAARRKLFSGRRALRLRTPEETTAYLAFIQKQGEEYFERSRRLAAAYALDEAHFEEDLALGHTHHGGGAFPAPAAGGVVGVAPPLLFPAVSLAEKIARKTELFYENMERAEAPPQLPPDFTWAAENPRRRWWQFWKPQIVRVRGPGE